MKGKAGINMYSYKAALFEVSEVHFGKPIGREVIYLAIKQQKFLLVKKNPTSSKLRK